MFDVAVVGSLNLDLVATCARHPAPGETVLGDDYAEYAGGKGLNQAVAASRAGAAVALIGAVGDDEAGTRLRRVAVDDGVDIDTVETTPDRPTGRALIVVDERGENSIVVVAGANATVRAGRSARARVVLAQLEIPLQTVETELTAARRVGATTILNPAPAQPLSPTLLATCDVLVPNEHEVELLGGADTIHAAGVETVIVTRGSSGVTISTRSGELIDLRAFPAEVVDTTGAGDAFCGNLAARLATGAAFEDAVSWAMAAGALAVSVPGAVASLPTAAATAARLTRA